MAPNVLARDFSVTAPNVARVGDITYLPVGTGWVYMAVLIDLYSPKVVGWALDDHMRTELCLEALQRALAVRQPAAGRVHHSNRGSQYASKEYVVALGCWIHAFYNDLHLHSTIGFHSPVEYKALHRASITEAA